MLMASSSVLVLPCSFKGPYFKQHPTNNLSAATKSPRLAHVMRQAKVLYMRTIF